MTENDGVRGGGRVIGAWEDVGEQGFMRARLDAGGYAKVVRLRERWQSQALRRCHHTCARAIGQRYGRGWPCGWSSGDRAVDPIMDVTVTSRGEAK